MTRFRIHLYSDPLPAWPADDICVELEAENETDAENKARDRLFTGGLKSRPPGSWKVRKIEKIEKPLKNLVFI